MSKIIIKNPPARPVKRFEDMTPKEQKLEMIRREKRLNDYMKKRGLK